MAKVDDEVLERFNKYTTGCYTERDGGLWYLVIDTHDGRLGEDFESRSDARLFLCALAGDPLPRGWKLLANGGKLFAELLIPGRVSATVWVRDCEKLFPGRLSGLTHGCVV